MAGFNLVQMAHICDRQISATFLLLTPFIQKGAPDSMDAKSVVCAGVCTIQRPEMLAKCLRSLAAQKNLDGLDFKILVVDNDATPSSAHVVKAVSSSCPFPIHYYHEPKRGIPMARNRVLESASAIGADWLAFLDDDQRAFPGHCGKNCFLSPDATTQTRWLRAKYLRCPNLSHSGLSTILNSKAGAASQR